MSRRIVFESVSSGKILCEEDGRRRNDFQVPTVCASWTARVLDLSIFSRPKEMADSGTVRLRTGDRFMRRCYELIKMEDAGLVLGLGGHRLPVNDLIPQIGEATQQLLSAQKIRVEGSLPGRMRVIDRKPVRIHAPRYHQESPQPDYFHPNVKPADILYSGVAASLALIATLKGPDQVQKFTINNPRV